MRISAVKQASSDIVEITTAAGSVFFIRLAFLSEVKAEEIIPGADFLDEKEMEILDAGLAFAAECKAEEYLARCEQCRRGLEKKLLQKGHSKTAVNQALDYLENRGLLDDLRFCGVWLRNHVLFKPQGRTRLFKELVSRGIKTGDAKTALDDFFSSGDELLYCRRAYLKALKAGKEGEKLFKYLIDCGFSYKMIKEVQNEE